MLCILEGFDSFAGLAGANLSTALAAKWITAMASTWATIVEGVPAGQALRWEANQTTPGLIFPITCLSQITMGFAFKHSGFTGGTTSTNLIKFKNGSTEQVSINLDADGCLRLYAPTLLGTTTPLTMGTWHFIDIDLTVDPSSGECIIYDNGVKILEVNSVDTQNATTGVLTSIEIYPTKYSCWDNIYICNDSGGDPTIYNSLKIENLVPTGDITSDWTPSTGLNHFAVVNSFDDTTYVSSSTVNQIDLFSFDSLINIDSTILGVMQTTRIAIDPVGVRSINTYCDSNSNLDEQVINMASPTFESIFDIYEIDPNTNASWSVVNLSSANFGVKVDD